MKKIAFLFVAAAMFAACGEKKAPAQETAEAEVAEVVEPTYQIVDDSTVIVTTGEQIDTIINDSTVIAAAKAAAEAAAAADSTANVQ
jgi:hypothetical protein